MSTSVGRHIPGGKFGSSAFPECLELFLLGNLLVYGRRPRKGTVEYGEARCSKRLAVEDETALRSCEHGWTLKLQRGYFPFGVLALVTTEIVSHSTMSGPTQMIEQLSSIKASAFYLGFAIQLFNNI